MSPGPTLTGPLATSNPVVLSRRDPLLCQAPLAPDKAEICAQAAFIRMLIPRRRKQSVQETQKLPRPRPVRVSLVLVLCSALLTPWNS